MPAPRRRLYTLRPPEGLRVLANVQDFQPGLRDGCADLVYTGKGALIWMPDLADWAADAAERRELPPRGTGDRQPVPVLAVVPPSRLSR